MGLNRLLLLACNGVFCTRRTGNGSRPDGWVGQKDKYQGFLSSWDSIFLYFLGWRRSETGDRFDMGNGSRVTIACLSQIIRSSQIAYCYTCGLFFTGATQGELPEGQEKVPWGITVSRNSLAWIFCTTPTNCTRYTVGCDKVNCPSGQEKVLWGTTRRTACIRPAQSIP